MPLWPFLSLLTAASESLKDLFSKKSLASADVYVVSWMLRLFGFIVLLILCFFLPLPALKPSFYWVLPLDGALNVVATLTYMRAIQQSDLSIVAPIVTSTPIFLLITSPLMLHEFPTPLGLAGVGLMVIGSYVLNISERSMGLLAPFRALFRDSGARLSLAVAAMYSITANLDKIGVQSSSPIFWSASMSAVMTLLLTPIMLMRSKEKGVQMRSARATMLAVGIFNTLALIAQMTAIQQTQVAYVISIKRLSAVISVLFGHWLFREEGLAERLTGAAIMVAGVVIVALS